MVAEVERLTIDRTPARPVRYEWAHGAGKHVPAKVAAEELLAIAETGDLTPQRVVDRARPATAPLHPAFEWDDAVAAERYRETQAGALLRHIVVRYADAEGEVLPPQRLFIKLQETDVPPESEAVEEATRTHVYLPVNRVLSDVDMRRRYLQRALAEAQAWMRRYRDISQFADVFGAIERAAEALAATE